MCAHGHVRSEHYSAYREGESVSQSTGQGQVAEAGERNDRLELDARVVALEEGFARLQTQADRVIGLLRDLAADL